MFSFSLSIPYLLLSSRQTLDGEISLHTLTPFGPMEISFAIPSLEDESQHNLNVTVEGDRIAWILDESLPPSFRNTLVGFVGKIVSHVSKRPVKKSCRLNVVFQSEAGDITLTGPLPPYAFASANG
jgi:hypothetical protein